MEAIKTDIQTLAHMVAKFEPDRWTNGLANDLFEAADGWRDLGTMLLNDKGFNIPGRVQQEVQLHDDLLSYYGTKLKEKPEAMQTMEAGSRIIAAGNAYRPPVDGYLGSKKIVQQTFGFLEFEFGLKPGRYQGMQWDYTSETVNVHFGLATQFDSRCRIKHVSDPGLGYSLEDLLFMGGKSASLHLPSSQKIESEADVQAWFMTVATILRDYGSDVLADRPDAWERLAQAAAKRERLINEECERLYGPSAQPGASDPSASN